MFKRGQKGVYHKMSKKHLGRYVTDTSADIISAHLIRMTKWARLVQGMEGKRLPYALLIANNGLESGARSA